MEACDLRNGVIIQLPLPVAANSYQPGVAVLGSGGLRVANVKCHEQSIYVAGIPATVTTDQRTDHAAHGTKVPIKLTFPKARRLYVQSENLESASRQLVETGKVGNKVLPLVVIGVVCYGWSHKANEKCKWQPELCIVQS